MRRSTSLLFLTICPLIFSGCEDNPFMESHDSGYEMDESFPSYMAMADDDDELNQENPSEENSTEESNSNEKAADENAEGAKPSEESSAGEHGAPAKTSAANGAHEEKTITKAFCAISPKNGSKVIGAVSFIQEKDGVRIIADVGGLTPGKHGFHVHEHGDCSASDASSAGGHFNPTHQKHGGPEDKERHVGDLGNLDANEYGFAHYDRVDKQIQLNGPDSIIGKSIVVHAGEDDLVTQPTGNSGKRIGCGVIHASLQ